MALFDLTKYDLKLELEKPNDKWEYFFGDKIKGKLQLTIKRQFYSKRLSLRLVKESKITYLSKLDNKETVETKQEFLFSDVLDVQNNYSPTETGERTIKKWQFQILIPKKQELADKTLMKRFFDAFWPAKIENKYYIELIFELPWPHNNEIIKKDLIVKEKI